MRYMTAVLVLAVLSMSAVFAGTEKPKSDQPETGRIAVIETNKGTIKIALYEKDAPITTKNFIELANRKFYDGLKFHRFEPGFVIQGGDPLGDGTGGSEKNIKLEVSPKLKHDSAGVIAMARTNDPDSASSQFYITLDKADFLDMKYAVFGKVVEGLDIVQKLRVGDVMKTVRIIDPSKPTVIPAKTEKPKETKPVTGRWAVIETNKGTIKLALYEEDAPITTKNFIELADRKFYDGLTFHRVEPGFVIQGGDPNGNGTGGSDKRIKLEVSPKLKHDAAGVLAMARTNDPDSATSQFYITLAPTPFLDMNYAVFGRVVEGLDVIQNIKVGDVMKTVRIIPDPTKETKTPETK